MEAKKFSISELFQLIQACIEKGNLEAGRGLKKLISRLGLRCNAFLGTHLIRLFASFNSLVDAQEVFENLPQPSVFAWSAIIAAHADLDRSDDAILLYGKLHHSLTEPDGHVHVAVLKACANAADVTRGQLIHHYLILNMMEFERCIGNTLIDMYGKCGRLKDARAVFDRSKERDVITWTAMISCCCQCGNGQEAINLFQKMQGNKIKSNKVTFINILKACSALSAWYEGRTVHAAIIEGDFHLDVFVGSVLIEMYERCGTKEDIYKVFATMPKHDVVIWNVMISACLLHGFPQDVFVLYERMHEEGIQPDSITFINIIKACSSMSSVKFGRFIHLYICLYGLDGKVSISNSLIDMYMSCRCTKDACHVFEVMPVRDVVTWSSMISRFAEERRVDEAFELFISMQNTGVEPNEVTYLSMIKICSNRAASNEGMLIHGSVIERGFDENDWIQSSLIEMHAKCGSLQDASKIFHRGEHLDMIGWSTMLSACSDLGDFKSAASCFEAMKYRSLKPDAGSFVCLLSACSQAGLLENGMDLFRSIRGCLDHSSSIEIYNCVIDLLARAGYLVEALDLILTLPFPSNIFGWTSILEHCKIHGNVGTGKDCYRYLLDMNVNEIGAFVAMSLILASTDASNDFHDITK